MTSIGNAVQQEPGVEAGADTPLDEALRRELIDRLGARLPSGAAIVDGALRRRAEYSSDASIYRVLPAVVVFPRTEDDILEALSVAREMHIPLTTRGAGTSIAGNAIGPGIILDTSRYFNEVISIDPEARTARVRPGATIAQVQAAAKPFGLRFGPDPSTWTRCTIGGAIGNNACGPHALSYGKSADQVVELDVVDGAGRRFSATQGLDEHPELRALVRENLAVIRTEFGRFGRQVSGYALEGLLPERGERLAQFLSGTEGTLGIILAATIRLVPLPESPHLVVLGYPSMVAAAEDVPNLLPFAPLALEGMDARLVDVVRRKHGADAVPALPAGEGWLMIEVGGATAEEARIGALALAEAAGTDATAVMAPGPDASAMWKIRADGAGLGGRTPSGEQAWPSWEDAAVPPEHLGEYLREFDALMQRFGLDGLQYGHFGDGCVHVRIDFPLDRDLGVLREFMQSAAQLVARFGGSMSGEHGDGRARSELLPYMYTSRAIELFAGVKHLFDPDDVLNPGVIVRPRPLDADVRRAAALPVRAVSSGFSFDADHGSFTDAVHRCTGVGKCRAELRAQGGFMCPSYLATKDEKDSTRGRARVLEEMVRGTFHGAGWASDEVEQALDLCLSCKACASDCPAGIDMAMYKSEVLHRKYRRRLRPMSHYSLGWLPRWLRLARFAPGFVSRLLGTRLAAGALHAFGGVDEHRTLPPITSVPFSRWLRSDGRARVASYSGEPTSTSPRGPLVIWSDSFSSGVDPVVTRATIAVVENLGYEVVLPPDDACCGLTWITTGQLEGARRRLVDLVEKLSPFARAEIPILGLEPSCTAVLRSDMLELLPDESDAAGVSRAVVTLPELLDSIDAELPDLTARHLVVQPHCHQYAIGGVAAERRVLARAGAEVDELAGCCGLAGNFGMEKGHYDVSVAVAENALLPALRAAPAGSTYLADGFSCRTQAAQLADVHGVSLAQLIADGFGLEY